MLSRYGWPVLATMIRSPGSAIRRAFAIDWHGPPPSPVGAATEPPRRSSPSMLSTKMSRATAEDVISKMQATKNDGVRMVASVVSGLASVARDFVVPEKPAQASNFKTFKQG